MAQQCAVPTRLGYLLWSAPRGAPTPPAQRERKGGDPKNRWSWWSWLVCAFLGCPCADDCRCYTAAPLCASLPHDPASKGLSSVLDTYPIRRRWRLEPGGLLPPSLRIADHKGAPR